MIIVETALALSVICTLPKRRACTGADGGELITYTITTDNSDQVFQMPSGISLERQMTIDLENIDGVGHVDVKELGDSIYSVNVSMATFEFSSYEKVIEKELELMKTIPDSKFNFNVTFAEATSHADLVTNAA
jgi:hypothetical protein